MAETKKKLTVTEFTMWLQGVEEMQDEGWSPSSTQWKRIREKINEIDDKPQVQQMREPAVTPPDMNRTVTFAQPALSVPTYAPSGAMPNPAADLAGRPFLPESPNQPAKTPSIDTSNGKYSSAFA